MITVYDFCDMCYDPDEIKVRLFRDDNDDGIFFMGTMTDAMESQYADMIVNSFDAVLVNNEITLNVSEERS